MTQNKFKVKSSATDTFIDTSYNVLLSATITAAGSNALKSFQEAQINNFSVVQGENIISESSVLIAKRQEHFNNILAFTSAKRASEIRTLSQKALNSANELHAEQIKDLETKESAFWSLILSSYISAGLGRNVAAMTLDYTKMHTGWSFFKGKTDVETKENEANVHWLTKNTAGILIGGLVGVITGLVSSVTHGAGKAPKLTGLWLGCVSSLIACIVAELKDQAILSKIEEVEPSSNSKSP